MSDSKPYGTRPNSHPSQPPAPALAHLPYRSRCPQVLIVRSRGELMIYTQPMTTSGRCYRVERPASSSVNAGGECPWPYAQEQAQQFAVAAAAARHKAHEASPKSIELVEVGLDVEPELPDEIDLAVFRQVLAAADRVRTDEGEQLGGTSFLLVADETPLPDIGYTLDKVENKGFVADQVCFMTGNIDKKLVKLMKLDGAHIVAAKKGIFLAISCQVEPSGEDMRRRVASGSVSSSPIHTSSMPCGAADG